MQDWYSAAEVLALQLPGLPKSKTTLLAHASDQSWLTRPRVGRGGGLEIAVSSLPVKARQALAKRELTAAKPVERAEPAPQTTLADWQRRTMEGRAAVLAEIDRMAALTSWSAAANLLIDMAERGELTPALSELVAAANARRGEAGERTLSRRSIYRWKSERAASGVGALAPKESSTPAPIPAWATPLLSLYRVPTSRPLAAVLEDLPGRLPDGVAMPSIGQARRFLERLSIVERERGRHGPNGLLQFRTFKRRSTADLKPMDVVTADGHTFKADVAHPVHGRPFRPEVCAVLDVTTRYVTGWSAGLSESASVTQDSIRMTVERFGQFGIFYTDNGGGFTNEAMTADTLGLLARLGATPANSIPGRAQARGKIERLQGTLWKAAARTLPTYNGRDMDSEARLKVKKLVAADLKATGASRAMMSWEAFLVWARETVDRYNNRPHRSLPKIRDAESGLLRHQTPAEAMAAWQSKGWNPSLLPAAIIDDLVRPYEIRTTRRGEVVLPWGRYFHQDLEGFGGDRVRVGYDIHDGSKVWVRTEEDGRLICIAIRDGNVIPEQPASKIEHANEQRFRRRTELLERHLEEVAAERGPRLVEHQPVTPVEFIVAARRDAIQAEIEAELAADKPAAMRHQAENVVSIDTPDSRFRRALDIERRMEAGAPISAEDARFHRAYSGSAEYQGKKLMYADFGDAILTA